MPRALAIAAHPDDIELQMAGALLRLRDAGWEIHCFNLSQGDCGSLSEGPAATARRRAAEARAAAAAMGAVWHRPIARDLAIIYSLRLLRRVLAVVRRVTPTVILTHNPVDYMEDHTETCRLAVSAAFARGMPNFRSEPARAAFSAPTVVYHAMPHGLRGALGQPVVPEFAVDIGPVLKAKRAALACHCSQKDWLDATQGLGSYLSAMESMAAEVGALTGRFSHAEGWQRHGHLGFASPGDDPLAAALPTEAIHRF